MIGRAMALAVALMFVSATARADCHRTVVDMRYADWTSMPTNVYGWKCERPVRLHCTLDGKPMAEWRERAGQYRIKLDGEWSNVPADAAGPMMMLLWAGGAKCVRR